MKPKILIVEDSRTYSTYLSNVVAAEGYLPTKAATGEEGIKFIEQDDFNLVLLDQELPGCSGVEVLEFIRIMYNLSELPVIFISSTTDEKTIFKALEDGANDFLSKPFTEIAMRIKIKNLLQLQQTYSELKQAKDQYAVQAETLKDLNATKDKFFSIIAHDLKNPLGNFKEVTKLLAESYNEFSEVDRIDFLNLMKESSHNIYSLLENLLEWSRSQRGILAFDTTELNLKILTIELVKLLKPTADKKQITIENNISATIKVQADVNMLHTVIRNLVSNALKFTAENGKITLDASVLENRVQISVQDTGAGIAKEIAEKLFKIGETQSTLGTSGETGTGLGLILCKEFVEKHGGKIWVESELGHGCKFIIELQHFQN